ncbi:MAG: aminopeptidase [Reichenbachiella sp.]|uniref:aminopeptidase n=1 Tax=Reichenbachiella sp. TaxID=2184521 RepID=UPI00329A182B
MNKNLKFLLISFLIIGAILKHEMISYLYMQGKGQFEVLWKAKPIEDLLNDDSVSEELKIKILLIEEIKSFAKVELSLDSDGLYTTLYGQQGKDILWNLTACEPYALKSVEWTFPIVGCVSYKGFFDLDIAKREEQELIGKGFDTRIRPVNAWSTLGWFSDPILSNNLDRSNGGIAELFIHEITHGNIFLKDSITFNENLASFIGEQGAMLFLKKKFGPESAELKEYYQSERDAQRFINHCLKGVLELDSLYQSFPEDMETAKKDEIKKLYMTHWAARLDSISFFDKTAYHGRFDKKLPNNAFFMAFDRYDSKKEAFAQQLKFEFNDDLKAFIRFYKEQ